MAVTGAFPALRPVQSVGVHRRTDKSGRGLCGLRYMTIKKLPRWVQVWIAASKGWLADGAFGHSAAVSFYTLFSLAPVTIITLAITGFFLGAESATKQFSDQISQLLGKNAADLIQETVASSQPQNQGWFATVVSIGVLVVGATTVFAQLQDSLNQIWGVKAKPSRSGLLVLVLQRLISFAMVLTVGFLLLVSLLLTTLLSAFVKYIEGTIKVPPFVLQGADLIVSLGVITVLFALVFKIMPDVQNRWRDVWRGAFATAILFTIGRFGIALYLSHSNVASIYGGAGSLVALLIWVYYSCAILFFGAEYTRAINEQNGGKVTPKKTAVIVHQQIEETTAAVPAKEHRDAKPTHV